MIRFQGVTKLFKRHRVLDGIDLGIELGKMSVSTHSIDEEDWAESWKKAYKPFRLGRHMAEEVFVTHFDRVLAALLFNHGGDRALAGILRNGHHVYPGLR